MWIRRVAHLVAVVLGLVGGGDSVSAAGSHMAVPPMAGFNLGVDISPVNLLPGQPDSPTGPALVSLLEADHVRLVRLLDSPGSPVPQLAAEMNQGGWRTIFDELQAAHINAMLLLNGAYDAGGNAVPGQWPPMALQPGAPLDQMSTSTWVADEVAVLDQIKGQCGGGYPSALTAIEVANEPTVDALTLPMLTQATAAVRAHAPGIPVTIGGWRAPAVTSTERWDYNDPATAAQVAPFVDFLSAHMYPDNFVDLPGGNPDQTSTDPATYLHGAEYFLARVVTAAAGKPVMVGEYGARDGVDGTPTNGGYGGSPAHQDAVVRASDEALAAFSTRGVTGGAVYLFEPHEQIGPPCNTWALLCFGGVPAEPALSSLAQDALTHDR